MLQRGPELLAEDLLVEQVLNTDADPHGPVGVRRTDAPLGGAQLVLAQVALVEGIQFLVVRKDQVSIAAEAQVGRGHTARLKHVHLGQQDPGINHHAVADDRRDVRIQNTTGDNLQGE